VIEFSRENVHLVHFAANQSHLQFCKIIANKTRDNVVLTEREREVLTWVARGKSNAVINIRQLGVTMTLKSKPAIALEAKITDAEHLQAQIDSHIAAGDEAQFERLSYEYEALIKAIFAKHHSDIDYILTKLGFSRNLLIAEHPMASLVDDVFESLRGDISLMKSEKD